MSKVKILTGACLLISVSVAAAQPADNKKALVELYVMSHCPYGVQAENGLFPALKALGGSVDLGLAYIADETPGADGKPGVFNSMHGPSEAEEDMRQLCARKLYPGKWLDYALARNTEINSDWKPAAVKAGLDPAALEVCVSSGEGKTLFSESIKTAKARNANASPTIYVDGKEYKGGRGEKSFTLALCGVMKERGQAEPEACRNALSLPDEPAAGGGDCGNAPPPVKFNIQVVRDSGCKECAPTLLDALKQKHTAAVVTQVEASSPEGKALIALHGARTLPLYVLGKGVEKENGFLDLLNSYYGKSADGYVIKPGPDTYTPTVRLDRALSPRQLDVFVDVLSPFAARTENELFTLLSDPMFKDLTFSMHFIVQEGVKADPLPGVQKAAGMRAASIKEMSEVTAGPLTSGSGEAGVQESLLQACLFQHISFGNYIAYLACRNTALGDVNRSAACFKPDEMIEKCVAGGEGENLLRQDAKTERELGINTSAAVLWENRYGPFGWHEVDLRRLLGVNDVAK